MPKELGERIHSSDIVPEIKELAVAWGDHYSDPIWEKFKLASDIQYTCIDLLNQFCKEHHIDPALVELFMNSKKETK